jgi:hypothetical protein
MHSIAVSLVLFLWNNPDWQWDDAEQVVSFARAVYPDKEEDAAALVIKSGVLADAFFNLLVEEPPTVCATSLVVKFAVSQCFKYSKKEDAFQLCRPSKCGRTIASLHHLLRAGVCSVLNRAVIDQNVPSEARDFMMRVKVAKPNSVLAGLTRFMTEREKRLTIKTPPSTFDENGDLCVGNEVFSKDITHQLIPRVVDVARRAIESISDGDKGWEMVLDPNNKLEVHHPLPSKFEFSILSQRGEKIQGDNLIRCVKMSDNGVMEHADVLISCCYASLQGFGCGAPRGSECIRVKRVDLVWSGGKMYYETVSHKVKSKHIKTRHCLPPCVSRVLLLSLCMLPGGENQRLFPKEEGDVSELVAKLWGRVFGIPRPVGFRASRQLFAAVANSMQRANPRLNFENPGKVRQV